MHIVYYYCAFLFLAAFLIQDISPAVVNLYQSPKIHWVFSPIYEPTDLVSGKTYITD